MDLHVLRFPESENHIFSKWAVCMCVCASVISITQKQITEETSNVVFKISITYRSYFKLFIKIEKNSVYMGTQENSITLRPMDEISH